MNWSKIKTIMICFLIVMNIFTTSFIIFTHISKSTVPEEVIKATRDVLKKDGFICNIDKIPDKIEELPILNTTFYSASDLSDIFFGKQLAFSTVKNSLVAKENDAILTVTENHFTFETSSEPDKSYSPEEIKKTLEDSGIDMSDAVYDNGARCFYKMYKKTNLFNMYMLAELDKNGDLCYVSALWPGLLTEYETKTLSFTSSVTKLKDLFPEGGTIETIEVGYSLKNLGNEKYRFTPSWRVKVGNELKIIE